MAKVTHGIVRTDNMSATIDGSLIVSGRFYGANDKVADVDNGSLVLIGDYDTNEREVRKVTLPTPSSKIENLGIVASPELIYDESTYHGLEDFYNEAGKECTVFRFHANDIFSVTFDVIEGTPAKNKYLVAGSTTKYEVSSTATGTVIGKIVDIETVGADVYAVVQVTM